MDLKSVQETVKKAKSESKKRNFKQTIEFIVNLKDIDIKKTEGQLDFFVPLHFNRGRKPKICALIGPELKGDAEKNCDTVIVQDNFQKYAGKKSEIRKLANNHDFFIAQANIMTLVASTFGRVLGPKGKMPNPKAGCVVPPKTNLKPLVEKLAKTIRVNTKLVPIVQIPVGLEDFPDSEVADNIMTAYDQIIHHLPNEKNNIRSMFVKLTMGKATRLE
ncbi:50S ribosomal protein L1 [Candidatus Woesearchaeota archaeon]|nr:50S ribosomal protein L1 [Candidatus Woesearchaeota archaeon]